MALRASYTLAVVSLINWGIFQKSIRADSAVPYFIHLFFSELHYQKMVDGVQKLLKHPVQLL